MFSSIIADEKEWVVLEKDLPTISKSKDRDYVRINSTYISKIIDNVDEYEIALDCGACYGFWSYLLHIYFEKIYAFELVNEHRLCFNQNMEKLNIKNVEMLPYAVGDVEKNCGVGIDDYFYKKFGYAAHNAQVVENKNGKEEIKRIDSFNFDNVGFMRHAKAKLGLEPKYFFNLRNKRSNINMKKGQIFKKTFRA